MAVNLSFNRLATVLLHKKGESDAYTISVLKKRPSPIPTTLLPAMSMLRFTALLSRAAPIAKKSAPNANAWVRPKLSDNIPAKSDMTVAGISNDEITNPCKEGERLPKNSVNEGMTMTGPMVPVSSLRRGLKSVIFSLVEEAEDSKGEREIGQTVDEVNSGLRETYPLSKPPSDTMRDAVKYWGGLRSCLNQYFRRDWNQVRAILLFECTRYHSSHRGGPFEELRSERSKDPVFQMSEAPRDAELST